jgi:hypothetical protein
MPKAHAQGWQRLSDDARGEAMPDRGEFRATTDQMLELIEELLRTEQHKTLVEIGSPAFLMAAKRAEEISRLVFRWAHMQLDMAITVQERIAKGEIAADVVLNEVQPRPLDRVLANWREAQFRLEIATPGSPEAEAATRDIERLREEYQAGHERRLAADPVRAPDDGAFADPFA